MGMELALHPISSTKHGLNRAEKRGLPLTNTDEESREMKVSPKRKKGGLRDWSDTLCQICSGEHSVPQWECPKLTEIAAGRTKLPQMVCPLCLKEKGGISHNKASASQPCWMSRKRSDGVQYDFRCQRCKESHFRVCSKCPQVGPRMKLNQQVLPRV